MIILKKLPFVDTVASMQELAELDTLANLKKHLAVLHSWVPLRLPQSRLRSGNPCRVYHGTHEAVSCIAYPGTESRYDPDGHESR